jgi:hypothetical protein
MTQTAEYPNFSKFLTVAALALALAAAPACGLVDNPTRAGQGSDTSTKLVHGLNLGGHAHADGLCRPLDNCTACHGADLKGEPSGRPSCFACHADIWSQPNCGQGTASHTVSLKGIFHMADYCQPLANCTACHGSDLTGGPSGIPGCTACHGPLWTSPDCGKNTHTVNLGGRYHASEYCRPYQNCVSCHGTNLRGGANGAPSCLKCHDQKKWMNCGTTQHNDSQEGVKHARNKRSAPTDCTPCHGADLRGGPNGEPSCYKCHGKEW